MGLRGCSGLIGFVYRKLRHYSHIGIIDPVRHGGHSGVVPVKLVAGNSVGCSPRKCRGLWATRLA
jgi:hypothetical protein